MPQIISDLWNENIAPVERCGAHDTTAIRLLSMMERTGESLCKDLPDVRKAAFHKYAQCAEDYMLRMMELAFSEGFRLGTRMMMESFL